MGSEITIESRGKKITLYHPAYLPMTGSMVASGVRAYFSINHRNIKRRWLYHNGIPSNQCGYQVLRESTLKNVTVSTQNSSAGTVRIRKNNETTDIFTMELNAENMKVETDINIFLDPNDSVQVFTETASGFDYPMVILDIYESQD